MSREEIQSLISTNEVEELMLNVRGQNVLLDRDVAMALWSRDKAC